MKKLNADLKNQMKEVGKGAAARDAAPPARADGDGDDGDNADEGRARRDDDDISEVGDGDATAAKRRRQAKEQATYEDDEDADEEAVALGELDDADIEAAFASVGEDEDDDMDSDTDADKTRAHKRLSEEVAQVESLFMENMPNATTFSFRDSGCTIGLQVSMSEYLPGRISQSFSVRFLHPETTPRRDRRKDLRQDGHP